MQNEEKKIKTFITACCFFFQGDNVRILCFSKNDFVGNNERVGYTWMQNGELIKMNVPHLYYEDLYLGGSVLFVNNVQVSTYCFMHTYVMFFK